MLVHDSLITCSKCYYQTPCCPDSSLARGTTKAKIATSLWIFFTNIYYHYVPPNKYKLQKSYFLQGTNIHISYNFLHLTIL
jgi:hypothetical protein